MAITRLDAAASVAAATQSFSVSAGSNRLLVVCTGREFNGATTVTAVDYGGQAMVGAVESNTADAGFSAGCSIWYLLDAGIAAASGTTITPTYSSAPADEVIHAASYEGVDQTGGATTNPATAAAESNEATPNPLIIDLTETDEGLVVAVDHCGNATTTSWNAAMTEQTDQADASSSGSMADRLSTTSANVDIEPTSASQNRRGACSASFAPLSIATVTLTATVTGVAQLVCAAISSVDPSEFDFDNTDVDIIGGNFEASQGSGTVYLSDASTLAGSANEVEISGAINTWSDELVNLDFSGLSAAEVSNLHTLGPGARFIILVNNSSDEYSSAVTLHRPQAFQMVLGAATPGTTTARLTGLTGTFGGGRIEETAAQNPSTTNTNVASAGNREDVWVKEAKPNSRAVQYDFRVLYGGNVADTITQTPQVTITGGNEETLAATVTGSATLTRVGQFYRTLAATVMGVATLSFGRALSNLTLAAATTGLATLIEIAVSTLEEITLAATATASATFSRIAAFYRTLPAASVASATLVRLAQFFHTLAVTVTGSATLTEIAAFMRTLAATATSTATLLKHFSTVTFSAAAIGAAYLAKRIDILMSATATGVATLIESLIDV